MAQSTAPYMYAAHILVHAAKDCAILCQMLLISVKVCLTQPSVALSINL